jgi:hypothetical protein
MKMKQGPDITGPGYKKASWSGQELTKFHMSFYDMERMDAALIEAHDAILKAESERQWTPIRDAHIKTKHAFVIFKWAYHERDRVGLMKDLKRLSDLIKKIETDRNAGDSIEGKIVDELIDNLWSMLDGIYQAKQDVGLGIPKVKFSSALAKIRKAMRS